MPKILVVDDSNAILNLLTDFLADEHKVITASNGKKAVETALSEMPDLIIMDVKMPVMDGLQATRILKEDPRTRNIPIIMLTALDSDDDMIMGLNAGASDYVGKPFHKTVLDAKIHAHLRTKALYDSLEQVHRDQEIVLDVTRKTTSFLNIIEVLHAITEKLAEYLNLRRCSVVLVDEGKGHGLVVASSDAPLIGGLCIYLDKYPEIIKAMETRETVIVDDVNTDPLMAGVREMVRFPYLSLMVVPIIFRDEVIGTLFLRASKEKEGFTEREANLCRMIAGSSANAMKNASLFEKLEEANKRLAELGRLKSSFIAMAAHELKTPLSIINGYMEMLLEGPLETQQADMLTLALESSTGLARIVDEMLDISVIESGQHPLDIEEYDMVEVIKWVISLMDAEFGKKGIKVVAPTGKNIGFFDRKRVRQVLINLLRNAAKFTSSGGEVAVSVEDIESELKVTVTDTGKGIPKNELDRVFDEFYRGEGGEEGTGLGLSICKRIVEIHGGRIWAESKEGKGSSFHFTLPKKMEDLNED
ncbi:MAG: ATP-binding protein [Deltaproteobacteria bacterium]